MSSTDECINCTTVNEKRERQLKASAKWLGATTFAAVGAWAIARGVYHPSSWKYEWIGDIIVGTAFVGWGYLITKVPVK